MRKVKEVKKKSLTAIRLCALVASVSLLGACEDKDDPRGPYTPEEKDEEPSPSEAAPEPEVILPAPTQATEPQEQQTTQITEIKEPPVLCISQRYSNYGVDSSGWDIFVDYELLHTDKAYGGSHPELRDALEEVNGLIEEVTGEVCSDYAEILGSMSKAEYEKASQEGEIPKYSRYKVYTRRADERILSFLVESRNYELKFDYEDISYMAYNFYVGDGSEVKLSDVVADEDALYGLLASKLEETVNEGRELMMTGDALKHDELKEMAAECIKTTDAVWVLDPQGISFYFDTGIFGLPWVVNATVLYAEDSPGTVFKDAFREDERDEWVMMLSKNCSTVFDAEDDGQGDTIRVDDIFDMVNGGSYYFNTSLGTSVDYNGKHYEFTDDSDAQPYDFTSYLLHRNGQTILMTTHSEFDDDYMDGYRLSGSDVMHVKRLDAGINYIALDEMIWGDETVIPRFVPADPARIPIRRYLNPETGEYSTGVFGMEADGTLTESRED